MHEALELFVSVFVSNDINILLELRISFQLLTPPQKKYLIFISN